MALLKQIEEQLTAKEVAKMLNLKPRTVYQLPIRCYRYGRAVRYELADVQEYKQSCQCSSQKVVGVLIQPYH